MNSTIAKLADEFEKMEKTIASQKKMIETLMPTGYVDTDTVKLHLNSVYGVMFGSRPSMKRYKLEDCSWDEINMYSSIGLADKVFEVGDTKKFRLADGSYLTARIIGFNHDYAEDGSLTHITFETVETLDGDIPMNEKSTNEGGWDASYLRAKLNGNFFEKQLPADLKAVIKPVVKITAKSGTKIKRLELPTHVAVTWGSLQPSMVECEQVRVVDVSDDWEYICTLPPEIMRHVDTALKNAFFYGGGSVDSGE